MSKFFDAIEEITFTENGARTFSTSGNKNLDFFALASAKRNDLGEAVGLFISAFKEEPTLAIRNLFYLRDVRGGQGERAIFQECMKVLAEDIDHNATKMFINLIKLIPEYGTWKDVLVLYKPFSKDAVSLEVERIFKKQLEQDFVNSQTGKSISLCAKWYPLANNTNNPLKRKIASSLAKAIFNSAAECRKTIASLRRAINVCEQKMSSNEWDKIDYSKLPSKAALRYRNAFVNHDNERYAEYINNVASGKDKINSGTLYPYEIIHQVLDNSYYYNDSSDEKRIANKTLEELWKNLPNYCSDKKAICVVDVSGSMMGYDIWGRQISSIRPIDVAISLGLYFAERNTSEFKGKFITFSDKPKLVSVVGDSLREKVYNISRAQWGNNTNIQAVFNLILSRAVAANLEQKDMPDTIYIISDMEFDSCAYMRTTFEDIDAKYKVAGYKRPNLVFWNVASRGSNLPVKKNQKGVTLISGASPTIFKYAIEGKTPLDVMLNVLTSPRYASITLSHNLVV